MEAPSPFQPQNVLQSTELSNVNEPCSAGVAVFLLGDDTADSLRFNRSRRSFESFWSPRSYQNSVQASDLFTLFHYSKFAVREPVAKVSCGAKPCLSSGPAPRKQILLSVTRLLLGSRKRGQ